MKLSDEAIIQNNKRHILKVNGKWKHVPNLGKGEEQSLRSGSAEHDQNDWISSYAVLDTFIITSNLETILKINLAVTW